MRSWRLPFLVGLLVAANLRAEAVERLPPDAVFPLPGETRAGTPFVEGRFGAFRPGSRPPGCGRGHCGVDLHAPDGTLVVAMLDGRVEQIERSSGGRGGRWVRIVHQDGRATWYMHLAEIRDDLVAGNVVRAGEVIGTLGRTGVHSSPTHLHLALTTGKAGHERHLDPTSLLAGSVLVAAPLP